MTLKGKEAYHLAVVCRLHPGDPVCLFNGDGQEYRARVQRVARGHVAVEVLEATAPARELGFPLLVACPMPKGDRAQFLLEKLTELGVSHFVPLTCTRRAMHPRELRPDKLQRYVIEASKQCGRNILLQIEPVESWEAFCRRADLRGLKILAQPSSSLSRPLSDLFPAFSSAPAFALAVGPEGGFTQEEIDTARRVASTSAGWNVVDLGPRLLRVETAAIYLSTAVILGKFNQP